MSKLLAISILKDIPNLYETEGKINPICKIKLFLADTNFTWYIIEIDKQNYNTCYGFVNGLDKELGYFNLDELENLRGNFGLKVERDIFFTPTKLSIVRDL